ncbi:hypothetical protein ACIQVK_18585 [Streptomyces sp. NPDC090493]|uniref:hypothetical protein n=1 Tax=Streptomyces sp. NPDC090493 TaxID=3365964 RepID=UPI003818C537
MSENTTASTELTSQYAAQVTSDLEHNLKEQDRVSGEIAALQQQLATLQHDHTVLVTMQKALGITSPPAEPTAPERATVPAPRKKAASGTSTTARAKKTTAAPSRERARKPAKKTAVPSPAAQPSLIELIRQHLADQSEPRSTVEITAALNQAHPERGVKNTVVRTTVENLVAKGQAQRTKQGRSVYYTSPDAPQPTPSAPTESQQEAQPEEVQNGHSSLS